MYTLRLSAVVLMLVVAGCNAAAPTQPAAGTAAESANDPAVREQSERPSGQASAPESQPRTSSAAEPGAVSNSIQSGFDQLSGRLTLLQEQVLQLRTHSQQLLEQNRMLLNRMQLLTASAPASATPSVADERAEGTGDVDATGQLDAAIGQLMQLMNQMDTPEGGAEQFALAMTYTRQGAWILLRYDRSSGQTWLADGGSWRLIDDVDYLGGSSYRVLVHRADQDTKGYVAVRIDEQTGDSWWLNGDRWQEYEQ